MRKTIFVSLCAAALAGCAGKSQEAAYEQKTFIMNVPAVVKIYGATEAEGKPLADAIFAEWTRVSGEFSFSEPYSLTTLVNQKAGDDWVTVNDEFLHLLDLSLGYYRLSDGAFDVTFAPLWPLWKEAASTRKMPAKEEIEKALQRIGSSAIQVDAGKKAVRFTKPVQVNLGGILRGYCFGRAYQLLKQRAPQYPVELRLGGNMLAYGARDWQYTVLDPFDSKKVKGRFKFRDGMIMCSSGRDSFVEIEGKLYSHILNLKTGYPIENFSNLAVYFPGPEGDKFLSSAVLAVMGRDRAFKLLGGMKGTAAVWLDGAGEPFVFSNADSKAAWEPQKGMF